MEKLNYRSNEEGLTSKRRVFPNIDKDMSFHFLAGNTTEFTQALNCELNRYTFPWVKEEKPVFRKIRYGGGRFDPGELIEDKSRILILTGNLDADKTVFEEKLVCQELAVVSSDARAGSVYIDKHRKHASVKYVATQQHLLEEEVFEWSKDGYNLIPLGELRNGIQLLEPDLREREACIFNLSAVRKSDAPGKSANDISGLSSEEACRILRYFGFGDHSRILWINGYEESEEYLKQTTNLVAQLVWYFVNGAVHRPGDYPISRENLIEFTISNRDTLPDLKFFKSRISGRWWFCPGPEYNMLNVFPCSYEDYQMICEGEISERISATTIWK